MYVWVYSSPIGQMKIHETGFDSWDSLNGSIPDAPVNLSEWERL